jgi:FkbM family methyltransferase
MLLDFKTLYVRHKLKIRGALHVGAHLAEEALTYVNFNVNPVYWIEGNPDNIPAIERAVAQYGHWVICALITDKDYEPTDFHITNYDSMSSSVLEFGTHTSFSPNTKFVDHRVYESRTLDSLAEDYERFPMVNFLNMDLQGAELLALKGARNLLEQIDYIYTEVNEDEVYRGCAKVHELDEFLADFQRVETGMVRGQGWGDALYVRTNR